MPTPLFLLDVDYVVRGNTPVVRIWGKTAKGVNIMAEDRTFRPYFYVDPKGKPESVAAKLKGLTVEGNVPETIEVVTRQLLGKEKQVIKVTVTIPADVPKFREHIKDWEESREEYEYDIPFARRYIIDKRLTPLGWCVIEGEDAGTVKPLDREDYPALSILAFDLELVEEENSDTIIMLSLADNRGFKKVLSYGKKRARGIEMVADERALIERFAELVRERDPDVLVGYNTDRFDFVKLDQKAKQYNIPLKLGRTEKSLAFSRRGRITAARLDGRVHVDLFTFVDHILSTSLATEVLSLDRVSKELIGKGKEQLEWSEIEQAWRKRHLTKIARYCLKDSQLALELAEYLLPQMYELCRVTGQQLFDTSRMFYSQLVEWLYMRKAGEAGEVAPNRPKYDEIERRRKVSYLGGYVHTPREGIHDHIAVFDFASLYPSITITHNISPETLECTCCAKGANQVPELKHHYCTKNRGFISTVVEDLVTKRIEVKEQLRGATGQKKRFLDNRQYALKILANASYGYYAYPGSRWYSKVCAESITSLGRMYIKNVISLAEKRGHWVIYGDTDSLFLKAEKPAIAPFLKEVNDLLPGVMELEFKGFYPSGLFVLGKGGVAAKKRYALLDEQGRLVVRGFERVRRDWSAIAKETQEKVLLAVLKDKSPKKALRIVKTMISNLEQGKVPLEELVIYTQLTKPISQYEQIAPHVAVAKKIIERGGQVRAGATMSYVVTKGSGSISDRAEPAEDAEGYDPDYYVNNQVLPAAMRILAGLGYKEEDILAEDKEEQSSLKKYMK